MKKRKHVSKHQPRLTDNEPSIRPFAQGKSKDQVIKEFFNNIKEHKAMVVKYLQSGDESDKPEGIDFVDPLNLPGTNPDLVSKFLESLGIDDLLLEHEKTGVVELKSDSTDTWKVVTTNQLVVIEVRGCKRCYLNITKEEAIVRASKEGYAGEIDPIKSVQIIKFTDEFLANGVWPI